MLDNGRKTVAYISNRDINLSACRLLSVIRPNIQNRSEVWECNNKGQADALDLGRSYSV